jgi:hypothetical protein
MARPRVFVSSTYYDLKIIREDLDRFISTLGYEPVRHERGHVSYGREDKPEAYAYKEIEFCDIVVSIVGGKYGTTSSDQIYSISQTELKRAIDLGKQVYIFVENGVLSEFKYYQLNKDLVGVQYSAVNDKRVYSFLEEIYALPKGNPIFSFETSQDLTIILREQLAGLFQRLLAEEANKSQTTLIQELQRNLQTVDQLVKFLTEEKTKGDQAIQEILFSNHPLFDALKNETKNKYRIYFTTLNELNEWLDGARGFVMIDDEDFLRDKDYYEWTRPYETKTLKQLHTLMIKKSLFDQNGNLISMRPAEWHDNNVILERKDIKAIKPSSFDDFDDDIPF